jgi:hypothetical protein
MGMRYVKSEDLTEKQKAALKKRLQQRKRELEAQMKEIDEGLAKLK